MKHDYTPHIVCPHCNHVERDNEPHDRHHYLHACNRCGEEFDVQEHHEVSYSTRRKPCTGEHRFEPAEALHVDAELAQKWNRERFINRTNWVPHMTWRRTCRVCGETTYSERLPIGSPCPWPQDFPDKEVSL